MKAGHKPGSFTPQGGWVVIYLGPTSPPASSGAFKRNGANGQPSFLGLAPSRVYRASTSRCCWCAYRTFAPLPVPGKSPRGHRRCVSVALSSRSPALALPSKPGHRGARTFLNRIRWDRSAPPRLLSVTIMPRGHNLKFRLFVPGAVAQPDRATVSQTVGRGFESRQPRHQPWLAGIDRYIWWGGLIAHHR